MLRNESPEPTGAALPVVEYRRSGRAPLKIVSRIGGALPRLVVTHIFPRTR